ncbi:MAG: phenylacetate--CoA ligase family protein, partial [Planctomycetota bacterium]
MSTYNWVVENLILPLSDLVLGRAISKHLRFVRKSQWWSAEELKEFQNEKLGALVKHAYENVPYYHDVFKERKLTVDDIRTTDDLVKLPILTKEIIRENFPHRIVAKNIAGNEMILGGSSGSTGEPLQYYTTKDAYSFNIACVFRGWSWAGFQLGDRYIKLSQNPREGLINKMQDLAQRCEYIHSQSLTPQDITNIVEVIRKSDAKLIRGYPSTLYVLSQYIEKDGITDIRPAAVTTTGE